MKYKLFTYRERLFVLAEEVDTDRYVDIFDIDIDEVFEDNMLIIHSSKHRYTINNNYILLTEFEDISHIKTYRDFRELIPEYLI